MKIALVAFATLAFASPALAATENPFAKDQVILDLKGLDLSTADGQQRLAIRLDQAARAVCGDGLATVHLDAENKAQACRIAVAADVRTQIEARLARNSSVSQVRLASLR